MSARKTKQELVQTQARVLDIKHKRKQTTRIKTREKRKSIDRKDDTVANRKEAR